MIRMISNDNQVTLLSWSDKKGINPFGLGIVTYKRGGHTHRLFPDEFRDYVLTRGAKIVCDSNAEKIRVAGALGVASMGLLYDCITSEDDS